MCAVSVDCEVKAFILKMILKFLFMAFLLSPITCEFVSISAQMEVSSLNSVVHSCTNRSRQFETNPRGCSWFWHCKDNEGNLFDHPMEGVCPDRLYFNYYLQSCSYDDGTCTYDEDNFNKIPTTCTDWRMDLIPHVFNCSKYYLCWENYTHPMECPEDLHFSYFENNCTVQNLADCRVDHNYCRRMRRDDVKVRKSPYDCNTYHVCNECNREFSLIEFECNKETHQFNETLQHCDITANVNCQVNRFFYSSINILN